MKPLAVWHVDAGWHAWPYWMEAEVWLREHGVAWTPDDGPLYGVFRTEIWLVDTPFAKIWRWDYQVDADGQVTVNTDDSGAMGEIGPVILPLSELPPPHLLRYRCVCSLYDNEDVHGVPPEPA